MDITAPRLQFPGACGLRRGECIDFEIQAAFACSIHHPEQRNIGQGTILIASADIGVDPREPLLLESLAIGVRRLRPDRRSERASLLIDR
jgi:hypothetical protein